MDAENKLVDVLKSRKFWATVVSVIVALGLLESSGIEEAKLLEAILVVVAGASYVIGVALEKVGNFPWTH